MYFLHLPSWFPTDERPFSGNFIEKHIDSISLYSRSITLRVVRCPNIHSRKSKIIDKNNITINYFIKKRVSLFGKFVMKISEWFYYKKGLKAIENEYGKPELIHLHVALPLGKFASHWSKKWKIPLILTEHWSIYTSYNKDLLTKKIVQKLAPIYKQVSGLTAVSQFLLDEIVCKFPVSVSKVIHNVVDTELFFPQQTNNSPKKILHISTLDERAKNFFGILKAVKLVSEKRQDFVLEVICEFRNLEAEKWIVENNLEKRVVFLGSMKEEKVAEVMKSCNFFLLFSNYETLSCVLLEAMSCGKAVITTPVGGIPEIMDTNRGVFVTPRNPAELAEKICFMLDNFEKFNPSEIRIYAETHFSKEIIGKQFDEFYKVALNIE